MYQKTVLRNGIRVVTEKIPFAHSVSTGIWVNTGSRDEDPTERGITHFIEHMLFKGTNRRSALDIAKEFDAVGGFANAFTSKEHVCFHAKVLAAHLPLLADLLTDIFLKSVFAPVEIEREQNVILQEIRMVEDTPDEFIHVLFQEDFWKQNPLGLPIYGTVETVEKTGRQQMVDFVSSRFNPERIVVVRRRKPRSSEFSRPDRSRDGNAQPFKPNSRADSSGSSFLLESRKKGPRTGTPGNGHAGDFADR